jgi:hypothetical protein
MLMIATRTLQVLTGKDRREQNESYMDHNGNFNVSLVRHTYTSH